MSRLPEFIIQRFGLWDATVFVDLIGEEWVPPSVNIMYQPRRGKGGKPTGQLQLSPVGRAYINRVRMAMAQQTQHIQISRWLYHFHMFVLHEKITNANFVQEVERSIRLNRPMKTTQRRRNKTTGQMEIKPAFTDLISDRDADGPLKKVQDTFFEVLGPRDNCLITSQGGKVSAPMEDPRPGMELYLIPLTEEEVRDILRVPDEVFDVWREKPL